MGNFIDDSLGRTGRILRGNRFKSTIFFPSVIVPGDAESKSTFYCMSTNVPTQDIGKIPIPQNGGIVTQVPGDPVEPPDWTVTVMADPDMTLYRTIERWKQYCASALTGLRANDLTSFGNAEVQLLDGLNLPVQTWELLKIYPMTISEIALSKEDRDTYLQFDVTFCINTVQTNLI